MVFTGILAFATVALGGATYGLYLTGEKQIRISRRASLRQAYQMQDSIEAAEAANKLNEAANKLNRENFAANRRAWLSVDDVRLIEPTQFTEDGFALRVEVTVKNLGQTPAISVWIQFDTFYMGGTETFASAEKRILLTARAQPNRLGKTIFPHDPFVQRELWFDDKDKVKTSITDRPDGSRKGGVSIFITASYCIFGDEKRHVTQDVYGLLNVPMGTKLVGDQAINLPPEPFLTGEID